MRGSRSEKCLEPGIGIMEGGEKCYVRREKTVISRKRVGQKSKIEKESGIPDQAHEKDGIPDQ
jgi:hypothetical protein